MVTSTRMAMNESNGMPLRTDQQQQQFISFSLSQLGFDSNQAGPLTANNNINSQSHSNIGIIGIYRASIESVRWRTKKNVNRKLYRPQTRKKTSILSNVRILHGRAQHYYSSLPFFHFDRSLLLFLQFFLFRIFLVGIFRFTIDFYELPFVSMMPATENEAEYEASECAGKRMMCVMMMCLLWVCVC